MEHLLDIRKLIMTRSGTHKRGVYNSPTTSIIYTCEGWLGLLRQINWYIVALNRVLVYQIRSRLSPNDDSPSGLSQT